MSTVEERTAAVKAMAMEEGFHRVGVVPAREVPGSEGFVGWLARGCHAGMAYLARNPDNRFRPELLLPGARSVICLAVGYAPGGDEQGEHLTSRDLPTFGRKAGRKGAAALPCSDSPGSVRPFVARYARGRDYHKVLKKRCKALIDRLGGLGPSFQARAFVDAGPVGERSLAAAAGLGWIGRNGCLIVPGMGSYVVLAEIVCNLELRPDEPVESRCDDCRACLDACPTGACLGCGLVDARRCLSYLTVECRDEMPVEFRESLGNRVFGCDACQEACPFNCDITRGDLELVEDRWRSVCLSDILKWTFDDWDSATQGSATRRATYGMFLRNAIIAAGNSGDAGLRKTLLGSRPGLNELDGAIDWSLGRL